MLIIEQHETFQSAPKMDSSISKTEHRIQDETNSQYLLVDLEQLKGYIEVGKCVYFVEAVGLFWHKQIVRITH